MKEKKEIQSVAHKRSYIRSNILWFSLFLCSVFAIKKCIQKRMRPRQKGGGSKANERVCLVNSCVQRTISGRFSVSDGSKSNRKHVKQSPDEMQQQGGEA